MNFVVLLTHLLPRQPLYRAYLLKETLASIFDRRQVHERLQVQRWSDLGWAGHAVVIEYAPVRVRCVPCGKSANEMVAWADRHQRQTSRL
ncbi:MAG TPA: hypothetical protein VF331_24515, partial [Polyangiales bacterium]